MTEPDSQALPHPEAPFGLSEADVVELSNGLASLPPHPDVPDSLRKLKAAGCCNLSPPCNRSIGTRCSFVPDACGLSDGTNFAGRSCLVTGHIVSIKDYFRPRGGICQCRRPPTIGVLLIPTPRAQEVGAETIAAKHGISNQQAFPVARKAQYTMSG